MSFHVYNSLTRSKAPFSTIEDGVVRMYNCGPTVYGRPHIGNYRSFLFADVLRRWLEYLGYEVRQVMNITDVGHLTDDAVADSSGEDKVEAQARAEKKDPFEITREYTDMFLEDMAALGVREPMARPRATEYIEEMVEMVEALIEKGFAYRVGDNVYFDVTSFPEYGRLSGNRVDDLEAGKRVEVNEEKRHPADFALWKSDPAHLMKWETAFGPDGFPGWHIECSAMAKALLGDRIDIHTGGEDNVFPHHECEIAQTEAHTGERFVGIWMHARHLLVDNTKMSKSLGNFYTVNDILQQGYSGLELRYALTRVQYRQSLNFTIKGLDEARAAIGRVNEARKKLVRIRDGHDQPGGDDLASAAQTADEAFTAAMCDDLNVSEALAATFELVGAVNKSASTAAAAGAALEVFARFEDVLAVFGDEPEADASGDAPAELLAMLEQRTKAKADKDWAAADALRDQIQAAGWKIVDTPDGARLERS